MKKTLLTLLLLGFKAIKGAQNPRAFHRSFMDLARLKASLMYVKSIETFRLLFVSALGIGICLVLLTSSLVLFHATLFLYAPLSAQAKMWAGFSFALVYFLVAFKAFSYVFSESQWLKIFHAEDVVDDITGSHRSEASSSPEFSRKNNTGTYKESGIHN
jgi:hypothetical protein